MNYIKEFKAAAAQSRKLGLSEIAVGETATVLDQAVLNALEETGHIPFRQRAVQGLNVNFGMFHMLAKKFHIPGGVLTMGNVAMDGEMRFPVTPAHFRKMVENESGEDALGTYHLWTTLPGGFILDHVLPSILAGDGLIEVDEAMPAERYLYGPADELPHGITYHPMVAGLEFLIASGTVDREAMEYLMGEKFPKQYGG
ncbi:hypothetical protein BerOc1_03016 [Pseudodesulfovibrio hydrargyri]|uniref:Uncharacterized protein n=1 Tax=Pseudodesulfovibrio hydrargyri TaxID=2125990 RepID=A0A1J5NCW1_9BACT|nr:hypothetical protein [Pseudodesulfovibrio hydrargyri]OIQ51071.1 hypothetical protein BerOc1_03016 [Pseudodesulfovibrio hydrargyri]